MDNNEIKALRTVVVGTAFLGKWFPGDAVQTVTDTLKKDGRVMVQVRTLYKRAVKTEVYANFPATEREIDGFLFGMAMMGL